ncbi:winged helix-turn-helix domain-containing protein [Microbacterium murale]|uniref:DNA-binding transcriptional ArsR family regulator n=1 Tax=Microbacterium murale TaxID=1081040 RepID=A0ABU0PDD3_9MICO|nr:helix-turn-helix domain-containing protein [Microbacterium murale]MDQ0645328.1 DNA-binding transcriptional ArsR family regulator [Microbacterium murale]
MEEIQAITAVHHPVRRRIVDYLGLYGASQVTTLARALEQQVGSISHHLRMLERAGIVERADAPDDDKRTSWWKPARRSLTWSTDDFEDSPSNALLAREAERTNISTQLQRLKAWHVGKPQRAEAEWSRAAFSTDTFTWASAEELAQLSNALRETIDAWRTGIDLDDGVERRPVFVFAHGFPTTP